MEREEVDLKLLDYLLNELDREKRLEVEAWIRASEKNSRYFKTFQRTHNYMSYGSRIDLIQGDFAKIRKHIFHRTLFHRLTTVAAVAVLLFGVALGWWIRQELKKPTDVPATAQICPGKSMAELHLSSGEVIFLIPETKEVQEKDGTFIRVDERGVIAYDSIANGTQKPLMNRITVPRGGEFQLTLEDGTRVWLNSNSEIVYPTRFTGADREVMLKGEAYFEVSKNKQRPFIVKVGGIGVKVYGTQFNINTQTSGIVETVLVEGSVGIQTPNGETMLQPNQKALYVEGDGKLTVENVDVASYIAWKDGNFVFSDETLEKIMNKLSLWYDVDVFYANDDARHVRLSGDMVRYKDIQSLLYFFERISKVKFQVKGRTIIISYK